MPMYKQIVWEIKNKIEKGHFHFNDKLPSINNLSAGYNLSRDTVEKAYTLLNKEGVVESVKRRGYFVKNANPISKVQIMLLFDQLSDNKRAVYNSIIEELKEVADVYLYVYQADIDTFNKLIIENLHRYHYYMVVPHFRNEERKLVKRALQILPKEKLILLDRKLDYYDNCLGNIYQDFENDVYETLQENISLVNKYKKLTLVFPEGSPFTYPEGILSGFVKLCKANGIKYEVISEINEQFAIVKGEAIITIEDNDLVKAIKQLKLTDFKLGEDFGILSYNDRPLKEVLYEGISVITANFVEMGKEAARMIKEKKGSLTRNSFMLIRRNSF
ncbi:putative transcriptional regulator [Flammeovirgaceae bacterium 311]|nr:putative transcriptional regulator [Flammeovirgaceae bacterium 311]